MAVNSTHPQYRNRLSDWVMMRDTYSGERAVKDKDDTYLPMTNGQKSAGSLKGQPGRESYDAYKTRAVFHDLVNDAVQAAIGVMHNKPPSIQLPKSMEQMLEHASLRGESLEMLLRRINEEQLVTGRLGLLLDVQTGQTVGTLPYIAFYPAESILNWDEGGREQLVAQNLNLVVLDESGFVRTNQFEWQFKNFYRTLILGDPLENEAGSGVYRVAVFDEQGATFSADALMEPSLGGRTLEEIPFVFINSKDIVPETDKPPLLGLGQLALAIYRGEADYRQALFMQGQDTLVVTGDADAERTYKTGANASISLPTGGKAEFIGVDSKGLPEMRQALENDKSRASQKGGQLLDSVSREKESGDALKIRVAARTATLTNIALAGAYGLQTILRIAAKWVGANPEEVIVTPNLDFVDDTLNGEELLKLMSAKQLGAPLSLRSIHRLEQEKGLTEMEFEEEMEELEKEANEAQAAADAQGNAGGGPVEDEASEDESALEDQI